MDFWVGALTRGHDDIDLAVWQADRSLIDSALRTAGWAAVPVGDEVVGAGYQSREDPHDAAKDLADFHSLTQFEATQ